MVIDGRSISKKVKNEIKIEAKELTYNYRKPSLAVILVGNNSASLSYVKSKSAACLECGIDSKVFELDEKTPQTELLKLIDNLNKNSLIDGILVQLPLPKHIDEYSVIKTIDSTKDVDGFNAINVGKLSLNLDGFTPCTPLGIMRLLKEYNIDVCGKEVCIIGRSNIVGKPMMNLMLNANATVTIAHSKTKNLKDLTLRSDIIIATIGKKNFITSNMVKDGAIVIDVGINRTQDGKIIGDVDFKNVAPKCSYITPVPGGVGPMTIAMLLSNTIKSAKNRLIK